MVPTKVKDLIPETANELGLPEEHLAAMYSFYVKENKKILSNMDHLHVILRGLGTMTIKGWEIKNQLHQLGFAIRRCRTEECNQECREKIALFERVLPKWEEQETRKHKVKKLKQEYYKNKEANNESEGKTTSSLE